MRVATWMIAATVMIGAQTLNAGQVFFTDFETADPTDPASYGSRVSTQGFVTYLPSVQNWFLWNDTTGNPANSTIFSLTGLTSHSYMDISFLLAVIDSWDGLSGPDAFNVKVDGNLVFSATYTNFVEGEAYQGTRLFYRQPAGFSEGDSYLDSAYSLAITGIPHTASTATIEFFASGAGWQGYTDESWAIDNLDVSVSSGVPEPGSMLLAAAGMAALFVRRRKR
jgi:hypothetical protein